MAKMRTLAPHLTTLVASLRTLGTTRTAGKRTRGRKLQRQRAALFANAPLCAECARHGRIAVATERDHIVPLADGGADDDENVQGLCSACHAAKTAREAGERARGV